MTLQWGYKRAFVRCALLFVAGTALQIVFGDLNNEFLRYPWGLIIALNYLYLLVLIHFQKDRWKWLSQLADHYACTSTLASMVVMTIIFGLTRQDPATEGLVGTLGFSRMTSSWAFNLLLLYFTTTTGLAVMEDLQHIRKRRVAAVLSHLAVFVVLVAGIFGSGDKLRVTVTLQKGTPSHWGVSREGEKVDMPFVLTLDEFRMEEYPAKLYVLDSKTQESSAEFLLAEGVGSEAEVDGWRLRVKQTIDMAARMPESDEFREMHHVGAVPAVKVEARNMATGESYEGWVSCGSFIFEPAFLWLGDRYAVAMPKREAKRYLSRIEFMDGSGEQWTESIEVNKPARIGAWRIYQVGYDTQRGRWSSSSVVECVKDGWWSAVQIALWMLLAAAVVMFLTAGGRGVTKKKEAKQ